MVALARKAQSNNCHSWTPRMRKSQSVRPPVKPILPAAKTWLNWHQTAVWVLRYSPGGTSAFIPCGMATVNFIVAEECIKLGLRAGAVLFRNVQVGAASPAFRSEIVEEIKVIRAKFASPDLVRSTPEVAGFREILRKVGINPRREQPSVV